MKYYMITVFSVLVMVCHHANAMWQSNSNTHTFTVESCAVCSYRCNDVYYRSGGYTPVCTYTKGTAQEGDTVDVTASHSSASTAGTDEPTNTTSLTSSDGGSYTCTCTPIPWD